MSFVVLLQSALEPSRLRTCSADFARSEPYAELELAQLHAQGVIDGLTLVKPVDGGADWGPLGDVERVKTLIQVEEDEEEQEEHQDQDVHRDQPDPRGPTRGKRSRAPRRPTPQTEEATRPSAVYVEGLGCHVTTDQLATHMKRCGVLRINPETLLPSVKFYETEKADKADANKADADKADADKADGNRIAGLKSALVHYVKPESVDLAVKYLDGSVLPDGGTISVQVARFEHKSKKSGREKAAAVNKLLTKKRRLAAKIEEDRLLSWADETPAYSVTLKSSRVLCLRPCWTADQAELYSDDSCFYSAIKALIEQHLTRAGAHFKKVVPITRHPRGLVCLKMTSPEEAESLIDFCQRQNVNFSPLACHPDHSDLKIDLVFYDGKTDLNAQRLTSPESFVNTFPHHGDLDAHDRLWLISAGMSPQVLLTTPNQAPTNANSTLPPPSGDTVDRAEHFGSWLECQSSDEEFSIKTEPT